jgi:phosphatidylglycerophosphate synthase
MDLRPRLQLNRRASMRLTRLFLRADVHPNYLTTLGLASGIVAGSFMALGSRPGMLAGAFALHLSFLLDNCDGELARLRRLESRFGRRYDIAADVLVDLALWTGLGLGAFSAGAAAAPAAAAAACFGSIANGAAVVFERRKGLSTSVHKVPRVDARLRRRTLFSLLEVLAHNGDSIFLAWGMAAIGDPWLFLLCGAVFINGLWLGRLAADLVFFRARTEAARAPLEPL